MTEESQYPLVTFALFAYNQEKCIREAVEAALAQDYPNLEIIISDDRSTDSTWYAIEVAVADYFGPHTVRLNRNSVNLGIGGHVSVVGRMARGELVVMAAGDDVSVSTRVSSLVDAWLLGGGGPAVIYSDVTPVDLQSNEVAEWGEKVFDGHLVLTEMADGLVRVLGASTAYTSSVFSEFDSIGAFVGHEDRVLPFRALLLDGKAIYVASKLVRYRIEGGVSRGFPKSRGEYVGRVAEIEARGLKDAVQRLTDLMRVPRWWDVAGTRCIRTIATHYALWDLARSKGLARELAAIRGVLNGGDGIRILKLYVKSRLQFFWDREVDAR